MSCLKKNLDASRPSDVSLSLLEYHVVVRNRKKGIHTNSVFARLGTDYEIRNFYFFAILEAMTTD